MAGALDGQVAIVTGGGRGIGRGIAAALAAAGAAAAVAARSAEQLADTAAAIEAAGGRALAVRVDVADPAAVARLVRETEGRLGPVDLLVSNAGDGGPLGPLAEADLSAWWRCLQVHVLGAAACAREALPGMLARGRGRLIFVGSVTALRPTPYLSAYGVAKAALVRLAETLAAEVGDQGVRVFAIEPGAVRTASVDALLAAPRAERAFPRLAALGPGGIWTMTPEVAGRLCLRLATGEADALSGRFLDARDDLDELIRDAEQIRRDERLTLRLRR